MATGGPALPRRLLAEAVGTSLLVTVVVGSGIAATNLTPDDVGLQLFYNSTATALGLTVLILLFGPASGAHLNPVVSAADWWLGRHDGTGLSGRGVGAYTVAQTVGGIAGALLANVMFDVPTRLSTHDRSDWHLWVGEVVATAGLVALIFTLARTGRGVWAAPAVGAYIGAAYWFTSSTSFANPSVTVGRMFSDTFAGIEPSSVPGFVLAQLVGAALGVGLVLALYPRPTTRRQQGSHLMTTSTTTDTAAARPRILYACRANGGRSVASRVLTAYYGGDAVQAYSAGSEPGDHIHAEVADVLTGLGLDVSGEVPKGFDTSATYDVVVTQGCGESCPVFLGARYADWPLDDPKGQDERTVRRIVADIDRRVRELLTDLVPDRELPPSLFEHSAWAR